jgi:hypothetical protein
MQPSYQPLKEPTTQPICQPSSKRRNSRIINLLLTLAHSRHLNQLCNRRNSPLFSR